MERDNSGPLRGSTTDPSGIRSLRDRAISIIAFATVLGLLYVVATYSSHLPLP